MRARGSALGITATLSAAVLWGSSFSVNDLGLAHVGPGTFAFLRFVLAALATLPFVYLLAARRGERATPARGFGAWFWGLCAANAAAFLLQYFAQTLTSPARTALFVNSSAFMVALLERMLFGMSLGWKRWAVIGLGFVGAGVLIVGGDPGALLTGRFVGDVLAMLAGAMWSLYFVYNDRVVDREDPVRLVAWTFAGTAVLLAAAPLLDPWLAPGGPTGLPTTAGWAAIAYSGVVTTALAFGLWTIGLTRIRASISAVLLMVEILVASLVSLALGRESFGLVDVAGALILVTAVVLASLLARSDAPAPAPEPAPA